MAQPVKPTLVAEKGTDAHVRALVRLGVSPHEARFIAELEGGRIAGDEIVVDAPAKAEQD